MNEGFGIALYFGAFALLINGLVWAASHHHWALFVIGLLFPPFGGVVGAFALFT